MQARALAKAAAAATILIIIALALGALLFGGRGREAPPEAPGPSPAVEPAAPAVAAPGPAAEPDPGAPPDPATAPGSENPAIELRGTLVVLDEKDAEHTGEDGEFLILRSLQGEPPLRVVVTAGKWRAVWTAPTLPEAFHVARIYAGGAVAAVEEPVPVTAPLDIAVRAKWLPRTVLRVIAKDTRKDLDGITVVAAAAPADFTPHGGAFGPEEVLAEDAASPLHIKSSPLEWKRLHGWQTIWARAPGYAWGSTAIELDKGGETIVALDREAVLEVVLVNARPAAGDEDAARIRLRRRGEDQSGVLEELRKGLGNLQSLPEGKGPAEDELVLLRDLEKRLGRGCEGEVTADVAAKTPELTRIDGLAPGGFSVCVEMGEALDDPLILGSAEVELRAGRTARVTVPLDDLPREGTPVPLEGTVHVPSAWGVEDISLDIAPVGMPAVTREFAIEVRPLPGRPGVHAWSAGKVPPGKYRVSVHDFGLEPVFEVPPQGKRDADIHVGEPVEVRVRVVDAETGDALKEAEVRWGCGAAALASPALEYADDDAGTGEHVFRAPAGRILVSATTEEHFPGSEVIDIAPRARKVTLALKKSCGVVITLQGTPPDDPDVYGRDVTVKGVNGRGRLVELEPGEEETTLRFIMEHPGVYEVRVTPRNGFAPVEPLQISIPPGEFVEHTIVLRRE